MKAKDQNLPEAEYNLGVMYKTGAPGVPANEALASKVLRYHDFAICGAEASSRQEDPGQSRLGSGISLLSKFLERHNLPSIGENISSKIQTGEYGDHTTIDKEERFTLRNSVAGSSAVIFVTRGVVDSILLVQPRREGASSTVNFDSNTKFNEFYQEALNECSRDHRSMGVILQEAFPNMAASAISRGDLLDNFQFVPYQVQGQKQELGTINVELAEKFVFGNVEVWYYILEETIQTVQDTMSGLPWPGWTPACSSSVWIRRIGH